jgi:acetyltransferase (GNAT) family protein
VNELERVEAQALRDAVTLGGGEAAMAGGAMCLVHPRVPMPELNRAMPLGDEVDVAAIRDWYGERRHLVCVPPAHSGLEQSLHAHGYEETGAWMKFRRGPAAPEAAPTDLRIEQVLDPEAVATAVGAPFELSGFVGAPGWASLVAFDGDEPVGHGALYVDGETAWIGVGATRAEWRGRGAQSALLAARIALGLQVGARVFVTETGAGGGPSYRNILRAGFEEAYLRPNWQSA